MNGMFPLEQSRLRLGTAGRLPQLNCHLDTQTPQEILAWSWATFGPHIAASSSFQTQSVALLHMIGQICPQMPIYFLDTGYHFPETLAYRDALAARFGLDVRTIYPDPAVSERVYTTEAPLYYDDPDLCCRLHKVEPMRRALAGLDGWVTGIRRDQTARRRNARIVESRPGGLTKINPLANWTRRELWRYIDDHDLPPHPLFHQGYLSVGCAPCTRPVTAGEDERAGRWAGKGKIECGLHTIQSNGSAER